MSASKPWTPEELKRLEHHMDSKTPYAKLTGLFCRSVGSIDHGRRLVRDAKKKRGQTSYDQDLVRVNDASLSRAYAALQQKYEKALKANSAVNQLVDNIVACAPKSYQTAPAIRTARKGSGETPQSAMLLLSDTHIGQVVDPAQTLSYGGYNFPTFLARLKYLEESVISIIENHQVAVTEELVIAMLGDMLHGALVHSVEAGQKNDLFTQYFMGAHAVAQFLRSLAAHVPTLRVKTVVGNHPRWGTQHKMPADQRYSNGDQFFYALIQALVRDIPNIDFPLDKQPMSLFEVQNFRFLALHGDTLKGGGTAGIPALAYAKEVSARTQMFAAMGERPINYYISGHIHKPVSLPHTSGACLTNGAFVGADGYTMSAAFVPVEPQQRLFFVHPKHGITAEYCLSLKWASVSEKVPYVLPPGFPIV